MTHSTAKRVREKPEEPAPDFRLFARLSGLWGRKIKGKPHCLGVWAEPTAALKPHHFEYPYWKRGEGPLQ